MKAFVRLLVVASALVLASSASSMTASQHLRHANQSLHSASTTLRFFEHHTKLLYTGPLKTRRIAWREVHRARVTVERAKAERARAVAALTPTHASSYATASWYGPGLYGNPLGCGGTLYTYTVGVASKSLACGTRLLVCYSGRCVATAVVDRGPYVAGRDFDLTGALAVKLGFGGVQQITWRLL